MKTSEIAKEARQQRRFDKQVDTNNANSQTASALFGLPRELRDLIYEYVFGTGIVHVDRRPGESRFGTPSPRGLMPAKCLEPDDWDRVYALSKSPANFPKGYFNESDPSALRQELVMPEDFILKGQYRHLKCRNPIYDYTYGHYASQCIHNGYWNTEMRLKCEQCARARLQLTARYGPPAEGLSKLHALAAFDLALLYTCKLIYREARALPFALYTFSADSTSTLRGLAEHMLHPFQIAAIETVHIETGPVEMDIDILPYEAVNLVGLLRDFPKLKHFRLSDEQFQPLRGHDDDWREYFRQSKLKSCQIIFGWDGVWKEMGLWGNDDRLDQRPVHRKWAEKMERFLLSSSLEEADATIRVSSTSRAPYVGWEAELDDHPGVWPHEYRDQPGAGIRARRTYGSGRTYGIGDSDEEESPGEIFHEEQLR